MLILTILSSSNLFSQSKISLDKTVHDFGNIDFGSSGSCEFKITNTGTSTLKILKCKASCGCTIAICDTLPILPNFSTVMKIQYDTKRVGPINKSITIHSNDINTPHVVVRISGVVRQEPIISK